MRDGAQVAGLSVGSDTGRTFCLMLLKQDPSSAGPSREVISPVPAARGMFCVFFIQSERC